MEQDLKGELKKVLAASAISGLEQAEILQELNVELLDRYYSEKITNVGFNQLPWWQKKPLNVAA